jgi:hypothetical protein
MDDLNVDSVDALSTNLLSGETTIPHSTEPVKPLLKLTMSQRSPTSSVHSTEIPSDLLAAAAQRRAQNAQPTPEAQRIQEYELRQAFRRLIDPGILRPNSKDVALASLNVHISVYCPFESIEKFMIKFSRLCLQYRRTFYGNPRIPNFSSSSRRMTPSSAG